VSRSRGSPVAQIDKLLRQADSLMSSGGSVIIQSAHQKLCSTDA